MADYKLPDVGEGLTEAEIVSWKVRPGDVVKVNDIVVEIETAKSLVELPSPYAGTVQALHVPEGETVEVGTPIITIAEGGLAEGGAGPVPAQEAAGEPAGIDLSNPAATGGGENQTLVGYGPRATSGRRRARRGGARPTTQAGAAAQQQLHGAFGTAPVDAPEVLVAAAPDAPVTDVPEVPATAPRALAKPPVRKLAKDLGVDLGSLAPSGPDGTVTRDDVERAAGRGSGTTDLDHGGGGSAVPTGRGSDGERREPVKGVRRAMARAMVESAFTAPHVTVWVTVDVTRTTKLVSRLESHPAFRDVRVSPLLVVAKAVCLAVRRTPQANAAWDDAAQEVVLKSSVNLGIAAATPRGLVVPHVKGADSLSLVELAAALTDLTRTAREGRTQPAQMSGGSFTITNVGVFGVDAGTPIINPGESAILCFGAVRKRPWVHKGRVRVRDVTTLALSFDHRVLDGEQGSRFLTDVASVLEDPASALLF
ncbi:MAG TPA: dihydrolipoamide acetyltransferase family protein [Nocardioidaceae bacterium]|nr:dihydrolipoamide acetyltransferase family protein [Nocardioidaceae bacterium]